MFVITGASSGIGRAAAEALIQRGCEVTVVARRVDPLRELVDLAPDLVRPVPADLGSTEGRAAVVAELAQLDTIAGIVHAAGSAIAPRRYPELEPDALTADMAVHVGAPIALNAALESQLVGGRIVYIDSFSAATPRQGWSGYSIVKAAAQMAARAAAAELDGASVVRLFPGGVKTPLVEAVLASSESSPTVNAFRAMDERGELAAPEPVGAFIANVLLDATDAQLAARDTWDFTKPEDQIFS